MSREQGTTMQDRKDVAQRAARAFDAAGDRLARIGVSEIEVGRAMLASGLARLSRVVPAAQLAEHLAGLTVALAETADPDRGPVN